MYSTLNHRRQAQTSMGLITKKHNPTTMIAKELTTLSSQTTIAPTPPHRQPYIPTGLKGLFAGSGRTLFLTSHFAQAIIDLTNLPPDQVNVLYIGTASYDIPKYQKIRNSAFIELGCTVNTLDVAHSSPSALEIQQKVNKSNIVLVSGGNTLYALDRWKAVGLDLILIKAVQNGNKVMAGGSAGAICWFDGGHSDSMDPGKQNLFLGFANQLLLSNDTLSTKLCYRHLSYLRNGSQPTRRESIY